MKLFMGIDHCVSYFWEVGFIKIRATFLDFEAAFNSMALLLTTTLCLVVHAHFLAAAPCLPQLLSAVQLLPAPYLRKINRRPRSIDGETTP